MDHRLDLLLFTLQLQRRSLSPRHEILTKLMFSNNKRQSSKIQCQMIHILCVFYSNISEDTIENSRIPYNEIFSILSIEKVFNQIPFDAKAFIQ